MLVNLYFQKKKKKKNTYMYIYIYTSYIKVHHYKSVHQYSCWKLPYVAFSFLVSFCEQFEIVWRSHISITQGVNELTKGKKGMINDFC